MSGERPDGERARRVGEDQAVDDRRAEDVATRETVRAGEELGALQTVVGGAQRRGTRRPVGGRRRARPAG